MIYSDFESQTKYFVESKEKCLKERETQTSKTILQLASIEIDNATKANKIAQVLNSPKEEGTIKRVVSENYIRRKEFLRSTSPLRFIKGKPAADVKPETSTSKMREFPLEHLSRFVIRKIRIRTVNKSEKELNENAHSHLSRSSSPNKSPSSLESNSPNIIPVQIKSASLNKSVSPIRNHSPSSSPEPVEILESDHESVVDEYTHKDEITSLLTRVKCPDWNTALEALQEIGQLSDSLPVEIIFPFMPEINQRLIQLLNSPRSHVCRMSCQIAGHLFKTVSDTRRPEFDDIIDLLLSKTADSNKFIKIDANLALDIMASNISPFHAIRAICNKGTQHKNDMVRVAAARLFVCIVTACGPNIMLGQGGNEFTRKRVLTNMLSFLNDKNMQVRHYGEELHKILKQHPNYQMHMKKFGSKSGERKDTRPTI